MILLGDFNLINEDLDVLGFPGDLKTCPGTSELERESFKKIIDMGFVDSLRYFYPEMLKYSWRSIRMPGCPTLRVWKSRIDYILISTSLLVNLKDSFVYDDYKAVSDHCPIGISLDL